MALTPPHAGIHSLEELVARGPDFIWEVAQWAKTRVKRRGDRALHCLSYIELCAIVFALDAVLIDHPDFPDSGAPARQQAAPGSVPGTEL